MRKISETMAAEKENNIFRNGDSLNTVLGGMYLKLVPSHTVNRTNFLRKDFGDISLIYCTTILNGKDDILTKYTPEILGLDASEFMQKAEAAAEKNHPATITPITDILGLPEQNGMQIYVLETKGSQYGAAAAAYTTAMSSLVHNFGSGVYVIPSSIYECLVIPDDTLQKTKELDRMIQAVNANNVDILDQLSNHVYHYDAQYGLELGSAYEQRRNEELGYDPGNIYRGF